MDTNKKFTLDLNGLKSANFPFDELFALEIKHNNVKYEFLVRFSSNNKNLICFGSGAYDPNLLSPPIYRRHSWYANFEESVIYYNDPTLYNDPDLRLGWGVGKNEEWYLPVISEIIQILASKNDIKQDNILFFGSSGGGFTAIILSTLCKNSAVLVNNPQVFLLNYHRKYFDQMIDVCFDNSDTDKILDEYGYRFDITELFKSEGYMPHITYLVNIDSATDVINQLTPFINKLSSFEHFLDKVKVLSYYNPNGHSGVLDKENTIELMKSHFSQKTMDYSYFINMNNDHTGSDKTNDGYDEGISVITPSYKGEKHISKLLESMKNQELSYDLFEFIIVINGELDGTYKIIKDFKDKNPEMNIKLTYSERPSASHARNIAIEEASRKYCTFIDDDDYISSNYLKELYNHASENRIVIGGFFDVDENTGELSHSYVTSELLSNSGLVDDPYHKLVGIMTMCTCKLIPTDKVKPVKFNDKLKSGVDTPFYCKLYSSNKFEFYVVDKEKEAIYYRVSRGDSLSRRSLSYKFNISERLDVIVDLNESLKNTEDTAIKNFIKGKITAQIKFMNRYLAENPEQVGKVIKDVEKYSLEYFPFNHLNRGIAKKLIVSYNFPPFACTSGNNMAKRVNEQAEIVDVIHNKVKRDIDKTLNLIADKYIDKKIMLKSSYTFGGWRGVKQFCEEGMKELDQIVMEKGEYEEIYSRSMFPASHFLAFEYKIKYPNVKWIAEFSDPLIHDIKGNVRESNMNDPKYMDRINELLSEQGFPEVDSPNIFLFCEYLPYVFADELIFTNENQKEYMITKFPYPEIIDTIEKKSQIKRHHTLAREYYDLMESDYPLDDDYVNLAYFGAFYETRNLEEVYCALYALDENYKRKCKIHFFTSDVNGFQESMECSPVMGNLEVNPYVSFFEFLNLTTKFDCLIVNDAQTKDYKKINPYLPSKLSDYWGSGTDIWMIYEEGSAMSGYDVRYKSIIGNIKTTMGALKQIIEDHR